MDKENNNIVFFDSLIKLGRFDFKIGMVIDQKIGWVMFLFEVIVNGIIGGKIVVDDFVDILVIFKDLIDLSKVNLRFIIFVVLNNYKMFFRDVLVNGFFIMNFNVKLDLEIGCVVLVVDEEIVQVLVDVKENLDWISDMERKLVL